MELLLSPEARWKSKKPFIGKRVDHQQWGTHQDSSRCGLLQVDSRQIARLTSVSNTALESYRNGMKHSLSLQIISFQSNAIYGDASIPASASVLYVVERLDNRAPYRLVWQFESGLSDWMGMHTSEAMKGLTRFSRTKSLSLL